MPGRGDYEGGADKPWKEQPAASQAKEPSTPTPERPLFPPASLPHHPPQAGPFQSSANLPRASSHQPLSWVGLHSHLRLYVPDCHPWPQPAP